MSDENDLDLKNYQLFDILGLFEIPYDYTDIHVDKAKVKTKNIEQKIKDKEIVKFYKKAFVIINCLRKFRESKKIANPRYINNERDDNTLITALLEKSDFNDYNNIRGLIQEILDKNDELNVNYEHSLRPEDPIFPTNTGTDYFDIANQKENKIINTFQNPVVQGTINPVKRIVQYTNLHLSSSFRDKYYDSDPCNFHYNLPSEIKNVISLRLASIEIPNAWYLFSYLKGNNRFKIEITTCVPCEGKKCVVNEIVVPDGNYDSETLIDYLNKTYFYQNSNEDDKTLKFIKISLDKFNNKTIFEIEEGAPQGMVFSLHFTEKSTDNMMMTLGWTLGFRLSRYLKIEDSIYRNFIQSYNMKPIIGILLGDATGIGAEITARVCAKDRISTYCRPILIGDLRVLRAGMNIAGVSFPINIIDDISLVRSHNNNLWMNILKLAFKNSRIEANKLFQFIMSNDKKITEMSAKLVEVTKQKETII